jgi:2-keto-4-pentenoate hydratase
MPGTDRRARLGALALELFEAEGSARRIVRLSDRLQDLTEAEAYEIAAENIRRRPGPAVGYKLGYTSAAMRQQMNISHPNFGVLTRERIVGPGEPHLDLHGLFHPRVEPELTIRLGRDLQGGGCTAVQVADAVDCVYPSVEVVDTRYQDYVFKAVDNIADNSSAARCVLGRPIALAAAPPLARCSVELLIDDRVLASGVGADAMGDPLLAVAWLANALAQTGRRLKAGDLVMTGGLTRAFEVRAGQHLCARFSGFEPLRIQCTQGGARSAST